MDPPSRQIRRWRLLRRQYRPACPAAAAGGRAGRQGRRHRRLQSRSSDPVVGRFAKLVELFDKHNVSFVSVTQQFNTTTSMGRLTLNVLLSFAQFEREVTSERI